MLVTSPCDSVSVFYGLYPESGIETSNTAPYCGGGGSHPPPPYFTCGPLANSLFVDFFFTRHGGSVGRHGGSVWRHGGSVGRHGGSVGRHGGSVREAWWLS